MTLQPGLGFAVDFPVAVLESSLRTKIARKSSYVELILKVADGADWPSFSSFLYPVFLDSKIITTWNLPYLNIESLPVLDTTQLARLDWLTTHTSMMFSARERSLRNNLAQQARIGERTRMEFKDSLFSMFMHYSGLQGRQAHIFGINCPGDGGVHILFFVSSIRLDLSNRTVVLDAAALPLYDTLMPRITSFLQTLMDNRGLCQINTTEAEMRVWKQVLPAMVERCRTWSHKPSCQYLTDRRVPLDIKRGQKILCSCGEGIMPAKFVTNVPQWSKVSHYAVRVAISPCFSAAMFEKEYDHDKFDQGDQDNTTNTCLSCQGKKAATGSGLLSCGGCQLAKYCSRQCQRAHWKTHKNVCKAI